MDLGITELAFTTAVTTTLASVGGIFALVLGIRFAVNLFRSMAR